jgi:HSP20 family protein
MAIQRFNERMDEMNQLSFSSMLDRFFNDSLNVRRQISDFTPHVDAYETKNSFEIEVVLPGLKEEEVNIDYQDGRLTISGERRFQNEDKSKRYHMLESHYGSFSRSFQLPPNTKPESIDADFENGVLHVSVKKEEQLQNRRKIEINSRRTQSEGDSGTKRMAAGGPDNGSGQAQHSGNDKAEKKNQKTKSGKSKE